jgi:hypothetical protein
MVLTYRSKGEQLNLSITEAKLQLPDQSPLSTILFSGTFPYEIARSTLNERLQHLARLLNNGQSDLKIFREVVSDKFLELSLENPDLSSNNVQQGL